MSYGASAVGARKREKWKPFLATHFSAAGSLSELKLISRDIRVTIRLEESFFLIAGFDKDLFMFKTLSISLCFPHPGEWSFIYLYIMFIPKALPSSPLSGRVYDGTDKGCAKLMP